MYKYNIYIGMFDKDTKQQELPNTEFLNIVRKVMRLNKINNYTIFKGKGHYMSESQVITEPSIMIEIVDYIDYCKRFTDTLKYQLRTELNQQEVLITRTEVEIL